MTVTHSGTPTAPITFTGAYPVAGTAAGTVTRAAVLAGPLTLSGVHDVTFDNFSVHHQGNEALVQVIGSQRVMLDRVSIAYLIPHTAAEVGFAIDGDSSDVTVSRAATNVPGVGPAVQVAPGAARITLTTNQFSSSEADVVSLSGVTDAVVTSNTIANNTCGNAIAIDGDSSAVVENNAIGVSAVAACTKTVAVLSVAAGSVDGVRSDYNAYRAIAPAVEETWGGTTYPTVAAFHTATGQGQHDLELRVNPVQEPPLENSPLIDSADATAPGELPTDFTGAPRRDDPLVADTGVGTPVPDRGADERQDTLTLPATTPSPASGQAPLAVTVALASAPTSSWSEPVTVTVDFGDGGASVPVLVGGTVTHTYSTPGYHYLTTTATDRDGIQLTSGYTVDVLPPPPSLTGAPTQFMNYVSGQSEVYANAGGVLVRRSYNPAGGWSGWDDLGGDLTGGVAPFTNLVNPGDTEVYANSHGHLAETYMAEKFDGTQQVWSGWNDLGGTIDGVPAAFHNPRFNTTEIYARSGTHVVYTYNAGSTWSGWNDLGGAIDGDPSVIYNPKYGTTEIYARSGTHLVYKYYAGSTWSGWNDLGGNLSGDPTVFYDAKSSKTEIYARSGSQLVADVYSGSAWSGWQNLTGSVSGDPDVVYNPTYGTTEVYVLSGTHVAYRYLSGSTWSAWMDLGGNTTSDPSVMMDVNGVTHVLVNSGGHLDEKVYNPTSGTGWGDWTDTR